MSNLKPCPFCGKPAQMTINPDTLNCKVTCEKCGVVMKQNFKGNHRIADTLADLMSEAWNRRAPNASD